MVLTRRRAARNLEDVVKSLAAAVPQTTKTPATTSSNSESQEREIQSEGKHEPKKKQKTEDAWKGICPMCKKEYDRSSHIPFRVIGCHHLMCKECVLGFPGCIQCRRNAPTPPLA